PIPNLHSFLRKNYEIFSIYDIRNLWRDMVAGVAAIHSLGLIHFDLKPANFLIVDNIVKVSDFGLARGINKDEGITHVSRDRQCGTPRYMPPEAFYQPDEGSASLKMRPAADDVWALGIILYQLLYGRAPYEHLEGCGMRAQFAVADSRVRIL
ncbi:unnamed protein product, partial [Amoebophrya sp. A120]